MPFSPEVLAGGVPDGNVPALILYIGRLPIPRDRREGLLRLELARIARIATLAEIEQVRSAPSP